MGRWTTWGALGLQNHYQYLNLGNPIFAHLWLWGNGLRWNRSWIPKKKELWFGPKLHPTATKARLLWWKVTWFTATSYCISMSYYLILQLQSKDEKVPSGRLVLRKILHNKGAIDPGWEGPFKIAKVLIPGAYKLSYLSGEHIPRSRNTDHLKIYYQ